MPHRTLTGSMPRGQLSNGAPFFTAPDASVLAVSIGGAAAPAQNFGLAKRGKGGGSAEGDGEGGGIPKAWLRLALAALIIACFGVLVRNALRMVERKLLFPAGSAPFAGAMKGSHYCQYARLGVKAYTVPREQGNATSLPVRYFAALPPLSAATSPATSPATSRERGRCAASVVVFHGNAGTAEDRIMELVPALTKMHLAVFLVEYPGYASDPLNTPPSESILLDNAVRAVDHLCSTGHAPRQAPLLLFGHSLGAAVSTYVARQRPRLVHSLLLLSPFGSVAQVVGTRIPHVPFQWVIKSNFNANTWARGVVCPATIVHGSDDVIVPLHLGQQFATHFATPPEFVVLARGSHNDMTATHPADIWAACARAVKSATAFQAVLADLAQ